MILQPPTRPSCFSKITNLRLTPFKLINELIIRINNEFKWGKSEVSNFRKTRRSGGWLKNHRSLHYWGYETKNRRKGKVYSWMDKTDQDVSDYLNNKVGEIKSVSVCV